MCWWVRFPNIMQECPPFPNRDSSKCTAINASAGGALWDHTQCRPRFGQVTLQLVLGKEHLPKGRFIGRVLTIVSQDGDDLRSGCSPSPTRVARAVTPVAYFRNSLRPGVALPNVGCEGDDAGWYRLTLPGNFTADVKLRRSLPAAAHNCQHASHYQATKSIPYKCS